MLGFRGRAEGGRAYEGQVAEDHSMLYSLINARRKDDGQPLSDLHICAQAFTFVLAGQPFSNASFLVNLLSPAKLLYRQCQRPCTGGGPNLYPLRYNYVTSHV